MYPPGPSGALWAFALVLWAAEAAVLGEGLRVVVARWLPLLSAREPIERFVLDLYLGGAIVYLVAATETGIFSAATLIVLPALAVASLAYRLLRSRPTGAAKAAVRELLAGLANPWAALAILASLGLFVVELAAALPAPTGNTYDSSLLTTYVALLLQHGSVPLSFHPYGAAGLLYPQGSTVWFGWAQVMFDLPAARTPLLVTPLFLALPPLSGYVLGRRWLDSGRAGAALALALAFLGPSTRAMTGGSNDFVLAAPLVLLLAALAPVWAGRAPPSARDGLAFGLLLGYAGALNVVGTEWTVPALLVLGVTGSPRFGGQVGRWLRAWGVAVGAALLAGIPSIYELFLARGSPQLLSGALSAPSRAPVGISPAALVGDLDPFLFRGSDIALSPVPYLRAELALLIVVGAVALLWLTDGSPGAERWGRFARWLLSGGLTLFAWELVLVAAHRPGSPVRVLAFVSNSGEFATYLFLLYGLLAAIPLVVALERATSRLPPSSSGSGPEPSRAVAARYAPWLVAVVLIVPAVALTPTSLSPVLDAYYSDFSAVSPADFAMLENASSLIPAGSRVLVAPGSAAEFLPGYVHDITLLYPMAPGFSRVNASYSLVVRGLTNGSLNSSALRALAILTEEFVIVTGNDTVLWRAFWAAPLLSAQVNGTAAFNVCWHVGDAWVFNPASYHPPSCP